MTPFKTFYFENIEFDYDTLVASFSYSFDKKVKFTEKIDFTSSTNHDEYFEINKKLDNKIVENILFHLHLAVGISYYKLFPTQELIIKSGFLNNDQIQFWKKFYQNGMGEFLFKNQIDPKGLFNFVNRSKTNKQTEKYQIENEKAILPFGGGKDSLVSFELLKSIGINSDLFTFGKNYEAHKSSAKLTGAKRMVIQRQIDPKLFEMNQNGYYNGHVPITGIISFALMVVSYFYDYKYIIFSNEKSADVENLVWKGLKINHQYSKSVQFEKDFNNYVKKYISGDVKYFSLLNGFFDLQVAKIFSQFPKYFLSFVSCNNNFKVIEKNKYSDSSDWSDQRRCLACPKCFSVFCMLRPWITDQQVIEIFGKDIYQDEKNINEFKKLLGVQDYKPFECVGTTRETTLAMYYTYQEYIKNKKELGPVLNFFEKKVLPTLNDKNIGELEKEIFTRYSESTIPKKMQFMIQSGIPQYFNLDLD